MIGYGNKYVENLILKWKIPDNYNLLKITKSCLKENNWFFTWKEDVETFCQDRKFILSKVNMLNFVPVNSMCDVTWWIVAKVWYIKRIIYSIHLFCKKSLHCNCFVNISIQI